MSNKIEYKKNGIVYEIKHSSLWLKNQYIVLLIVISLLSILLSSFIITKSMSLNKKDVVASYSINGKSSYRVNLKENNYYNENTLKENMNYVSNLIDSIDIDYNYGMHLTSKTNYNYSYNIKAILNIKDKNDTSKILYSKEYLLLNKSDNNNSNSLNISERVTIDYSKYNDIVNEFKKDYNIITLSEVVIKLDINVSNLFKVNRKNNTMSVTIPLSEQTTNITKSKTLAESDHFYKETNVYINNIILFVLGIIFGLISVVMLIFSLYLYFIKYARNPYEQALHKLLKEYDSYIINAKSSFNEVEENLIRIENFNELLDAQRLENRPILFYEVEKGKKSYFVIQGEHNTYRFTLTDYYQLKHNPNGVRGINNV